LIITKLYILKIKNVNTIKKYQKDVDYLKYDSIMKSEMVNKIAFIFML